MIKFFFSEHCEQSSQGHKVDFIIFIFKWTHLSSGNVIALFSAELVH
jgi:hypothetical protein